MKDVLSYLDYQAERGGEAHLHAGQAMQNEMRGAMFWPTAFTASAVSKLRTNARRTAQTHIDSSVDRALAEIQHISSDARRRALEHLRIDARKITEDALSDDLSAFEDASVSLFSSEIAAQTTRDLGQVLKRYRNSSLRVLMISDVEQISRKDARDRVVLEEGRASFKLWFRDSAYRKIPSHKFARKLWRQVMRDHWVQVYMKTLAEHGEDTAVIWHTDSSHHAFGLEMCASQKDYGLEKFEEIFHPNARALPMAKSYMESIT